MAELDNVPQTQSIEIAKVKVEESLLNNITELNNQLGAIINEFGQIYIRKKEISEELIRLDEILERAEDDFKLTNNKLKEALDELDEKYPQGRLNLQDGTIQYQPGAPTRKQLAEAQNQQPAPNGVNNGFKVVKE
jgi:predicted nuclease with TOPRIM domain